MTSVSATTNPPATTLQALQGTIAEWYPETAAAKAAESKQPFALFVRTTDEEARLCGGVTAHFVTPPGATQPAYAKLDCVWMSPELRGKGVGRALVEKATTAAVAQAGVARIELVTLDYQAPAFYDRCGYVRLLEHHGWPDMHTNVWMQRFVDPGEGADVEWPLIVGDGGFQIMVDDAPTPEDCAVISSGLDAHNQAEWARLGVSGAISDDALLVQADDASGGVCGVLFAMRYFDFANIMVLAVRPDAQRQGVATALLHGLWEALTGTVADRRRAVTLSVPGYAVTEASTAFLRASGFHCLLDDTSVAGGAQFWEAMGAAQVACTQALCGGWEADLGFSGVTAAGVVVDADGWPSSEESVVVSDVSVRSVSRVDDLFVVVWTEELAQGVSTRKSGVMRWTPGGCVLVHAHASPL